MSNITDSKWLIIYMNGKVPDQHLHVCRLTRTEVTKGPILNGPHEAKMMWKMCRFRSSCTCSKYHPGFCSPFIYSVVSNDSVSGQ